MTESALWSHDSPEWYTPSAFVEAARAVMGGIDVDPASHKEANRTVRAMLYYDETHNGLTKSWFGRVFLNPPGGLVNEFWRVLMKQRASIAQAIWIGYSFEQLQTLQIVSPGMTPLDWSMCVPRKRLAFVENEAKQAARWAKIDEYNAASAAMGAKLRPRTVAASPSHGNYISYIGGGERHEAFAAEFGKFGQVVLR